MTLNFRVLRILAVGLVLVAATAGTSYGQAPPTGPGPMAQRQKMMADMKAAEQKLDGLVAAMNQATGSEKVDRMAAVLTELVAQHREMHQRMMAGGMMGQMPMMQNAAPATTPAPKPEGDHGAHH